MPVQNNAGTAVAPTRGASVSDWCARSAKIVLIASTLLAMIGQVTIAVRYWSFTPWVFIVVLAGFWMLGRAHVRPATQAVLGSLFLAPAILQIVAGTFPTFHVLWFAAVIGVVLASPGATRWSLPPAWRPAVACWALVLAFSCPIIVGRELEWNLDFLYRIAMPVSGSGLLARNAVDLILDVALTHTVGLLWLDWMFSLYASERQFRRLVIAPLVASWAAATLVGVYQLTVDMSLLNPGYWVVLRRAAGPIGDANGFGMICAMWGPITAALMLSRPTPRRGLAAVAFMALSWIGVWGSGSRNAFVMAVGGVAALLFGVARTPALAHLRLRIALGTLLAAGAAVAAGLVLDLQVIGPLSRLWELVPNRTVGEFLYQFWDRGQYGSAGLEAIKRAPLVGVGIGSFYHLVADIWYSAGYSRLPPDNAQSWYRHELAELGIIGSIGWIVWLVMVATTVLRPIRNASDVLAARVSRAVLVLLGIIELVGIPTQVFAVAFSFLTILAWHVCGRRDPASRGTTAAHPVIWLLVWGIALLHSGMTIVQARGAWRVPNRAVWGWYDYEYGLHRDITGFAWTDRHAVLVQRAQTRWLKLTVWVNHPDSGAKPVKVDLWRDGEHIVNVTMRRNIPLTQFVSLPDQQQWFVLETKVDRTFRPSDYGSADTRDLGLAMKWEFVPEGPK